MTSTFAEYLTDALGRSDSVGGAARWLADDVVAGGDVPNTRDALHDLIDRRRAPKDVRTGLLEAWADHRGEVTPDVEVVPATAEEEAAIRGVERRRCIKDGEPL